ncbi:hypothetical protein NPIL_295151 [Nephila pilipes]|uniref:Uncharacterized protein n=1 Tax=Nephila pilipes TaxID=299642 RepID=A0A8X6UMJ6_NEPPI|nr:hypothetical protein NPIL_295151 [Nephila pilipes]
MKRYTQSNALSLEQGYRARTCNNSHITFNNAQFISLWTKLQYLPPQQLLVDTGHLPTVSGDVRPRLAHLIRTVSFVFPSDLLLRSYILVYLTAFR